MIKNARITALRQSVDKGEAFEVKIYLDEVEVSTFISENVEFEHRSVCPIMGPRRFITKAED